MANDRILKLSVHNVKGIKDVTLIPGDNALVIIGGRNGQGKSSLLDSVLYALGGKKALPKEPVRQGEEKAEIVLELKSLIISRTMTETTDKLVVSSREGAKFPSPQSMLDKLVGSLSFDPLAFSRMGDSAAGRREQAALVMEMAGLNFDELDRTRADKFSERTGLNRDLKKAEARLADMKHNPTAPAEEISISGVAQELEDAREHNRLLESTRQDRKVIDLRIKAVEEEICELKGTLASLVGERDGMVQVKDEDFKDTSEIEAKLASAEEINQQVRENKAAADAREEVEQLKASANILSKDIKALDDKKAAQVKEASLPMEGLSFDEDGLTLNGIPFSQASASEQLRTSVAMGLSMNPELKVMLIDQGSELDEDSLKVLSEMAEEAGAQVWMTRVSEGEECTVIMEAGSLKE